MTHRTHEIVRQVALLQGVPVKRLLAPGRYPPLVDVRRKCAMLMREAGLSYHEIGRQLCRDHSTIFTLVNGRSRQKRPVARGNA